MRPYGAWVVPTEEDELEKALNRVPDEVSVEAAPFIQEGSLLAAGGGEPSSLEEPMVPGSKQSPADAAKFEADHAPPPQADTREAMLRKVFEAQQKYDEEKSRRMAKASRLDRKRQNEEDLSALLYATFARKSPQFRNLGKPFTQEAASVGNDGPLSRELALQKVLAAYQTKPEDPLDQQKKLLEIDNLNSLIKARGAPKASGKQPLSDEERGYWEKIAGKPLPPGATVDDVGRLGAFVRSENSLEQSRNQFGTRLSEERGKEARNETKAQQGMEIPGWSRDPNVRVDEPDVRMLRDASAQTQTLKSGLAKLEALFRKHGNTKLPSAERAAVKLLVTDLKLQAKGPAMYQLGVLSKQDDELLSQVVPDPASGGGTLADFFSGGENTLAKLSTLRGQLDDRINAKMGSRGYSKASEKKKPKATWNGTAWEIEDG